MVQHHPRRRAVNPRVRIGIVIVVATRGGYKPPMLPASGDRLKP
jgi:hypothetical protein